MVILSSPLILERRSQIVEWAIKARLPTIGLVTLFPSSGGLMAYGPSLPDMYKRAAIYIDRILKGAKAADLPIERPTRFTLVINVNTAKAIGLKVPPIMLTRADEVIRVAAQLTASAHSRFWHLASFAAVHKISTQWEVLRT